MKLKKALALISICIIAAFSSSNAQELPLSEGATASMLTCGSGNDFYTTFGHSAIRITDTANGIDWVYNYGTFDFNTPNFYWKFTRGQLNYRLSREHFSDFMLTYNYEQRAVWEQKLNFTHQEINNLYTMLEWNNLPENRYYLYDIFRDNCATRVRDMICAATDHRDIVVEWPEENKHSYRYFLHSNMHDTLEWWRLGIDLLLGMRVDKRCTTDECMYHPIQMMQRYDCSCATLTGHKTLEDMPLTGKTVQLLADTREPMHRSFPPLVVFALLFLGVGLLSWKRLWPRWADRVLFVVAGIIGLFLTFMWAGTGHWCTAWNLNILWASPMLILIAIRLERSPLWALWLQEACFLVSAAWVIACGLSPAILPIILTLALRVAFQIKR